VSLIQRIYVAGYKHDIMYARSCVASIRKWYTDIPITLIKDESYGPYSTSDIENYFNADVLQCDIKQFGWGFSKLEALYIEKKEKFLIVDADTVLMGPVLDLLNDYKEDFVVPAIKTTTDFQENQYFDPTTIEKWDDTFKHTGYGFNTGQWVGTSGIFKRSDLTSFVNYKSSPISLYEEGLFKCGEQGFLNYFLFKHQQLHNISLAIVPFMEIGNNHKVDAIQSIDDVQTKDSLIIHWAGIRTQNIEHAANGWILKKYIDYYYDALPFGKLRYFYDNAFKIFIGNLKVCFKKLIKS